jgi:hypothetical protein
MKNLEKLYSIWSGMIGQLQLAVQAVPKLTIHSHIAALQADEAAANSRPKTRKVDVNAMSQLSNSKARMAALASDNFRIFWTGSGKSVLALDMKQQVMTEVTRV